MSNSYLSFFNRSGNSPTLQRMPNETATKSASERGKEHRKKKGDEGREQDRVRKQVDRADAKTPEGMRILEEIVGNESVDENMRSAAAKKILATPLLSMARGCEKLVYTGHANMLGNRYSTERGRRVTASGASPSDNSKDATWVSFHDKEKWRHDQAQKQYGEDQIIADLVTRHFNTTTIDGKEHYECDLCKQLIFWPRDRGTHILQVHGSRNSPSHERRFGNIIAEYKKQLKAD